MSNALQATTNPDQKYLTLAQPLDFDGMRARIAKVMPPGYYVSIMAGQAQGNFTLVVSAQSGNFRAQVSGTKFYPALADLRRQIKVDQRATRAAAIMCVALGLMPEAWGPFPLGPMQQIGVQPAGYGGVYIGPGAPEMRRNVDWLKLYAVMMQAAMEAMCDD